VIRGKTVTKKEEKEEKEKISTCCTISPSSKNVAPSAEK
jgi:hypothetical protein